MPDKVNDIAPRTDEIPEIAKRDWRLRGITTLAKDAYLPWNRKTLRKGSVLVVSGYLGFKDNALVTSTPSAPALFLSQATKMAMDAKRFLSHKLLSLCKKHEDGTRRLQDTHKRKFFDCLEQLIAIVISSFTALEVFANESIPDDFEITLELKRDKEAKSYDKEQIERRLDISTKLDQVLPVVFDVDSPKGTKIWQEYKILKDYRDRLIHMKSSDLNNSGPDNMDDYIWSKLLDPVVLRAPEIAVNMIQHFFAVKETPRWLKKRPWRGDRK